MVMHKTSVEIDLDALREAEVSLGTRGVKETVNRALEEVNRRAWHEHAAQYIGEGRLRTPDWEEWQAMRRGRFWGFWDED